MRIANEIRPGVPAQRSAVAGDVRDIAIDHEIVGLARSRQEDIVGFPVAEDPRERPMIQPALTSAKWQVIYGAPSEQVRNVVRRLAIVQGRREVVLHCRAATCTVLYIEIAAATVDRF